MNRRLRILHLEDNRNDAELVQSMMFAGGFACDITLVQTRNEFAQNVEQKEFDLILSDFSLPSFDGLSASRLAREKVPDIPFILVSGTIGEDAAIDSLLGGATDYVLKTKLSRLVPAVRRALHEAENERERKRAEEELHKLWSAVEQSVNCIYITNRKGIIEYVNPGFTKTTGYSKEDVIGKTPRILKSGKHDNEFYKQLWKTLLAGEVVYAEFINKKKNEELVYQEETITPVKDLKGNITHFIATGRDVTERKRAEEELKLFRTLIDRSSDAIEVVDPKTGRFLDANQKACFDLGYSREELLALRVFDIDSTVDQSFFTMAGEELRKSGVLLWEGVHRRKDGSTFPVEISITYVQLDRDYIVSVARDITERKRAEEVRKQAEEALKQSEEHYRTFFEDDLTGDYISTPDGKILSCNLAFVRIFGFASIEQALNTNASTLSANPEERKRFLSLLREKKRLEYYETEYIRRDGKRVHSVENAIGIFDAQGDLVQIRGYLFDDTKRKLLEEQLLQAQKLEGLGTLAGGIAHDFNNILGIILGHSGLLKRFKQDPQKLSQSIEAITKATERGASLVKQLLTFARKTEALFESVSINDMIGEIIKLLKETFPKTITISTSLQQDLPAIVADASQIHQVLLNLCVNARDAMPKGGTLSISTRTVEGEAVSLRFAKGTARKYVQIEVADTGIGMDESTRQRIFEPFFTTKAPGKGTGLGLAVVFGIIENHTGFIDVRSVPGEGTSLTVYLPIPERAPEVPQRARKGFEEIAGGTETILVIEDEEMLRELVKAAIVSKGYTVLTAEDGARGVETYQSHQKEIAVVLSDIGLPILSGQDVLRRIREINPEAKVIMASGFIDPETKSEMYKAGAKHIIQKPYLHDEVLQKIREVIDSNG